MKVGQSGEGFGDALGRANAALVIKDQVDGCLHVIHDRHQFEIAGADEVVFSQSSFHPFEQPLPVIASEQN